MDINDFKQVIKTGDWSVTLNLITDRYGNDLVSVLATESKTNIAIHLTEFSTVAHPQTVARYLDHHGIAFKPVSLRFPALLVKYGFKSGDPTPEQSAAQPDRPKKKCEACGKGRYAMKTSQGCFNFVENPAKRQWQCQIFGYGNTVFLPSQTIKAAFFGGAA